ncbi:MAG: response regulator receiver [Gammaproteobacteria bacterium]|nr:MAG: response regulator receiver [Gammaproteobacteria bacterium]TND06668.1 MAG: response regulator receiver modulated diguanylate cyclase/phosphodiesterase [Gammaproteobacteria bacterium]
MATIPKPSAPVTPQSTAEPSHMLVMVDRTIDISGLINAVTAKGFNVRATNIDNPRELKPGMVTSGNWELILTPVSMAPEVLKLQAQCTGTPPRVIVFGPTEDVTAVEFLEQGAADVVRTQPPERLHMVVARELAFIAERHARLRYEQLCAAYSERYGMLTADSAARTARTPADSANTSPPGNRDVLTGLYTRNYFIGELDKGLADPDSLPGTSALMHIAIDNFDFVREKLGVAAADLALADVAAIVSEVIGTDSLACRFGSRSDDNVFLAMIRNSDAAQIRQIADRLCTVVAAHESEIAGKTVKVTCSVGVCPFVGASASSQKLIYWAALSGQIAQKNGGNRIHAYDAKADAKAVQETGKEQGNRLSDALKNNRFKLVFQPIVNLCAAPAERYEVLLRMLGDNDKEIMPAQFIPAAEKGGLMPEIDRWVINKSIQTAAERYREGNKTNFFVKISNEALADAELVMWISTAFKTARVPGDAITFELTENAVMAHPEEARLFLKGVKELHCHTALERAGMNPGALETLEDLPLDFIKFDRSLTHDFPHNPGKQERLKKLARASHELHREAIAEFVQDARTLRLLWQCGIDYIQGYYLQQPDGHLAYEFSAGAG